MAHYGLLENYRFAEAADDIRGATLYGRDDEKLGKIDDVIFDHSTGDIAYVVVDTGWLRTKKFIVPADGLRASSKHEDDFVCNLTKEQVESFPPYDKADLASEEKWSNYEGRYRSKWETSPVMHRAETDRNITPTTQQMQGNRSPLEASGAVPNSGRRDLDEASLRAADSSTGRVVPAGTDSVVIENSAVGIGERWDTFQARLRERRKEAVTGCTTCTVGPESTRESADRFKKAV
jgi:hypothetical protein